MGILDYAHYTVSGTLTLISSVPIDPSGTPEEKESFKNYVVTDVSKSEGKQFSAFNSCYCKQLCIESQLYV